MKPQNHRFSILLIALAATPLASAQNVYTFTGNTTNTTYNWSTASGWDVPPTSGPTTELVFGTGGTLPAGVVSNNNISGTFSLNKLTTNNAGQQFTVSGNQLNFVSNGATTPTILLTGPQVVFTGAVNFGNDISIGGTGDIIFSNTITNTGGTVVTKTGTGTMRTEFDNSSYTGNFNVTGGTLQVGNNGPAGDYGSGTVTLSNGANFVVRRKGTTGHTSLTLNNQITGTGNVKFQTQVNFVVTINKANGYNGTTTLDPSAAAGIGGIKLGITNALPTATAFTITNSGSSVQTFDLNGFDQTLASLATGTGGSTTNSIITNTGAAKTLTISNSSGSTTYAGLISGAIALTKSGDSTQILSGANTYNSTTTITGGKLSIGSTGTINSTSGITIGAGEFNYNSATALSQGVSFSGTGGKLSGSGAITPAVTVSSGNTLAPGNSIGTLSFGSGLALAGTYSVELGTVNANPALSLSDRAAVTGALTVGGNLTLVDNGGGANGSASAGAYRIATYTTNLSGTFSSITNPLSSTLHEKVVYGPASGGGSVDLNLYRLATANTINTPLALGNVRVGGTLSQNLTIQNTATNDGFSEGLNASGGALTGSATTSGSITNLAAGSTSNSTLSIGLSTGTAGSKTGTVTISLDSNGSGTSGYGTTALTGQTITVNGAVYNPASAASSQTATLNTRPGVAVSTSLSLTNTGAAVALYQETLGSTGFSSTTSGYTTGGSITGLAGGASGSGSLTVGVAGFSVPTPGAYTGATTTLNLQTEAVNSSGLGNLGIASQTVNINVNVYDYATATLSQSGDGTFTGGGTSYTLNFGTGLLLNHTYTATINFANGLFNAYKDSLAGAYGTLGGPFSETANNFASLTSGSTDTFTISFNTGSTGTFSDNLTFDGTSLNGALGNSPLSRINIGITANAVPEPDVSTLIGGIGMLFLLRRRR